MKKIVCIMIACCSFSSLFSMFANEKSPQEKFYELLESRISIISAHSSNDYIQNMLPLGEKLSDEEKREVYYKVLFYSYSGTCRPYIFHTIKKVLLERLKEVVTSEAEVQFIESYISLLENKQIEMGSYRHDPYYVAFKYMEDRKNACNMMELLRSLDITLIINYWGYEGFISQPTSLLTILEKELTVADTVMKDYLQSTLKIAFK